MISYDQARNLVMERARILGREVVSLDKALGRVAAEEIRSRIPVPPFRNSAVDGYAVKSADTGVVPPARLERLASSLPENTSEKT